MNSFQFFKYCLILLLLITIRSFGQSGPVHLEKEIKAILDTAGGKFGIGVQGVDFKAGFLINGERGYPMQSVFKFPLALKLLHQVDEGKLNLDQKFQIPKEKLD